MPVWTAHQDYDPSTGNLLQPRYDVADDRQRKEERRHAAVVQANKSRRDLEPLAPGDKVFMQPIDKSREWERGVVQSASSRSYEVASKGKIFRRNRQFLRQDRTEPTDDEPKQPDALRTPVKTPSRIPVLDRSKETPTSTPGVSAQSDSASPARQSSPVVPSTPKGSPAVVKTRSGRTVRAPQRLHY